MCVCVCSHLLSLLVPLDNGCELVGQLTVLLTQFIVAVALVLDLSLDVHYCVLEVRGDLRSFPLVLLAALQQLLLPCNTQKRSCPQPEVKHKLPLRHNQAQL